MTTIDTAHLDNPLFDGPLKRWPTTPRRQAAMLRSRLRLPEVKVTLTRGLIDIRWTEGPAPVHFRQQLEALPALTTPLRWRRLIKPATFGAALLDPDLERLHGWDRGAKAWKALQHTALLDADTYQAELLTAGSLLASMAGVSPHARFGWHMPRGDSDMVHTLDRVGHDVIRAVLTDPRA